MTDRRRAVVVGGSAAGVRAAERLADNDSVGEVVVVSRDPHAPYYRPALSKQVLTGEWDATRAGLARPAHARVRWLAGRSAVGLDLGDHRLYLDDGTEFAADVVVLAPGCRPRTLPGVPPDPRVVVLHRLTEALELGARLRDGQRLVIVGAGLIGSEIAAAAVKRGVQTTLVDPSERPLARSLGPLGDRSCRAAHLEAGCALVLGVGVAAVEPGADHVEVVLTSGERLAADAVAVCVGVVPDTEWLADSGVPVLPDGGLRCDSTLTVAGHEWLAAAGDAAAWWVADQGRHVRVEHWFTALAHGTLAADNVIRDPGDRAPFIDVPLFWTEQHGVMMHVVGWPAPRSVWDVVEGDPDAGAYVAQASTDGRLSGALLVASAHRLGVYRKLVRDAVATADARAVTS